MAFVYVFSIQVGPVQSIDVKKCFESKGDI